MGVPTGDSRSSPAEATFNFVNSIVGAGIIGLPFALHQAGFVWGVLLMVLVALLTVYTTTLIVRLGVVHGISSYDELCTRAFGERGFWALAILQFCFAYGAMVAYLVILADTVPTVLDAYLSAADKDSWLGGVVTDRHQMTTVLATVVVLPLCTLRNFSALSKTSALSLLAVGVFVVSVVYKLAQGDDRLAPRDHTSAYWSMHSQVFTAVGTISFAFICHHQSFLVFNSLEDRSLANFSRVANVSVGSSVLVSMLMAVSGYLTFLGKTDSDIFNNYAVNDELMNVSRLMLALTMLFTYPMEFSVSKLTVEMMLDHRDAAVALLDSPASLPGAPPQAFTSRRQVVRHWVLTLALWGLSLVFALVATSLDQVLNLTGGFAATAIGFLLPAGCYLKLGIDGDGVWHRRAAQFTLFFGLVSFVMSTGYSLYDLATGKS